MSDRRSCSSYEGRRKRFRAREREREGGREGKKERSWSIFRGYLRRFVRTYLSSPGDDSSSGPNTTVFGSRECLIPRCCMWLLSCRARGGHIPKPRETRSDTDAHEHANKQNYSSIDRGIPHRYPIDLFPPLRPRPSSSFYFSSLCLSPLPKWTP